MNNKEGASQFKQSLSLFDAVMIVAGSMIGSGIFIVTANMSRQLGSPGFIMLEWIVSAVITLMAALSYGELAGMMPQAGGQYVYLKEAYNPLAGFLYGWTCFMVIQTGFIAAVGVAFAKFTTVFFPALGTTHILLDMGFLKVSAGQLFAIAIIILITFINTRGIEYGKLVQGIFTSTKLLALAVLVMVGLYVAFNGHFIANNFHNMWQASSSGFALLAAMGVAMVSPLFSSDAWNNVTFISAEIKRPSRNIPLALLIGTLLVGILYILSNITYFAILPLHDIAFAKDDRVATAAVSVMLGSGAAYVMAALIMVSTFGCNNGIVLSGARLYYAMAKDHLFFRQAMKLNSKGVPAVSLIFQCIWACVLCLSGTYSDLLDYITIASLLFYALTISGVFILRKKKPDAERPYKVFAYPFLPAIYVIVAVAISIDLLVEIPKTTLPGIIIVLAGIPFYFLLKKSQKS